MHMTHFTTDTGLPCTSFNVPSPRLQKPLVFLVHGGAWTIGKQQYMYNAGKFLASHCDTVCVTLSYNLSLLQSQNLFGIIGIEVLTLALVLACLKLEVRQAITGVVVIALLVMIVLLVTLDMHASSKHPQHVNDVANGMAYVRTHIHNIVPNVDLDSMFLVGHSAGAHIVSLLACDPTYLANVGIEVKESVKGVIGLSGVYSSQLLRNSLAFPLERIIFGHEDTHVRSPFPIDHLSASTFLPPFLLVAARGDYHIIAHTKHFEKAITDVGHAVTYYYSDCDGHGSIKQNWGLKPGLAAAITTFMTHH